MQKLTVEERRAEFNELIAKIPGNDRALNRWLVEKFGVSKTTARIWRMKQTKRPMPEDKLKIFRHMLQK